VKWSDPDLRANAGSILSHAAFGIFAELACIRAFEIDAAFAWVILICFGLLWETNLQRIGWPKAVPYLSQALAFPLGGLVAWVMYLGGLVR
jgi:hypothetical protein